MDGTASDRTERRDTVGSPTPPAKATVDSCGPLLEQVAHGDEVAFASLYDDMAPVVYGLCLRLVEDPAQAEAVARDVLVEIWRTAGHHDAARDSGRGRLTALAHRRAVDRMVLTTARYDVSSFDQVIEAAAADSGRRQVRRCLLALTRAQRQAIILAYFGGRTYQQVAKQLGLPVPTVRVLIRDGMIRLRDSIGAGA